MEKEKEKKPGDILAEEKLRKWLHDVGLDDDKKEGGDKEK